MPLKSLGRALVLAFCVVRSIVAVEVLSDFQPTAEENPHGPVRVVRFATNVVDLGSGVLAYYPPGSVREVQFSETVWVVGYETEIVGADGKPPTENYQCHSFLSDEWVEARQDQELSGIFSDAYTQELRLPTGFGLRFPADTPVRWITMFNNREDTAARISMRVAIYVIRDRDITNPLRRLRATTRSVKLPPLFWVPPGLHSFETIFRMPSSGTIHFMGSHVHPYAKSMELFNVSRSERVWQGSTHHNAKGVQISMDTFSSAEGYRVASTETLKIVSVYDNLTDEYTDAMAGMFIFYAPDEAGQP